MPEAANAIGMTTTVPVEIIYAAGRTPVDLNNIFVADPEADKLVAYAEARGFPQSACAWTKGLYGAIHAHGIKEVVGVVEGDCSNTYALCEILESEGIAVHPFGKSMFCKCLAFAISAVLTVLPLCSIRELYTSPSNRLFSIICLLWKSTSRR